MIDTARVWRNTYFLGIDALRTAIHEGSSPVNKFPQVASFVNFVSVVIVLGSVDDIELNEMFIDLVPTASKSTAIERKPRITANEWHLRSGPGAIVVGSN